MIKYIFSLLIMFLSIIWFSYWSNTGSNTTIRAKEPKIKVQIDDKTKEKYKKIEQEKNSIKIINAITKENKTFFIWLIMNDKLKNKLNGDKVTINISWRDFFITNFLSNYGIWITLTNAESLNLINKIINHKPILINIYTSTEMIMVKYEITKKDLPTIKYEQIFNLKYDDKTWKYNISYFNDNLGQQEKTDIKVQLFENKYITKEIKVVPWFLWYTSLWQIVLLALFLVISIWWAIIWYFYKKINTV